MKKIVFGALLAFLLSFTGCLDDDGYSLGDQWIGFGVLQDADNLRIKMDNNDILKPIAYSGYYNFETRDGLDVGDRVFVNFTILDDSPSDTTDLTTYFVKINSLEEILLKQIIGSLPILSSNSGVISIICFNKISSNELILTK